MSATLLASNSGTGAVTVIERYPSGMVKSRVMMRGDQPHGVAERWYADGTPASREQYWRGAKVGRHLSWWPTGRLRSDATYDHDAYQGEYRTWYASGQPYELRHFDRGHESGIEQSWNPDGALYLNYEVRQGRRYGLMNASPCVPADKDGW
jgi:antitoxin component YwqK of YwqJK toxin-antitoxin module